MGFRFRRSIRLAPGVRVNISKKGVSSVSLGGHGATVNVGKTGAHETVGLPGTGLSYRTDNLAKAPRAAQQPQQKAGFRWWRVIGWILLFIAVVVVGQSHFFQ